MNIKSKLLSFFHSLGSGLKRFPISILVTTILAFVLLRLNHFPDSTAEILKEDWLRAVIVCIMGIPVTLSVHLLLERLAKPPAYHSLSVIVKALVFIPFIIGLVSYGWFLLPTFDMQPILRSVILIAVFVLLFACVPYWWKRSGIALHTTRLLIRLFITVLYSGIFMLSLFAILFTLDRLLGVDIKDKNYLDAAIIVWSIFAPFHFFAGIPGIREMAKPLDSPKTLRFLMHWILIPLLWIYTGILYVYSGKILVERVWPEGLVSSLILAYSCVGLLLWFLSSPTKTDNKLAGFHHKWFGISALPLFFVLFSALGIRIREYGITEPRYFALILSIWCTLATLYIAVGSIVGMADLQSRVKPGIPSEKTLTANNRVDSISMDHFQLPLIALIISLALTGLLSVVGPVNAFETSIRSQNKQFREILDNNQVLNNNSIVISKQTISNEDQARMNDILYWFERNHELDKLSYLPDGFELADTKKVLGYTMSEVTSIEKNDYAYYHIDETVAPYSLNGFDLLFPFSYQNVELFDEKSGISMISDIQGRGLILKKNGVEIHQEDLKKRFLELYQLNSNETLKNDTLPIDKLSFDSVVNDIHIRLIIKQMDGSIKEINDNNGIIGYAEGWIMVDIP